jgi:hypothetical protein
MAITYKVPSPYGTATRKSARHSMAGQRYRFVTFHVVMADMIIPATSWRAERAYKAGTVLEITWHSRRDLALKASGNLIPGTATPVPVEILDEHCREAVSRKAAA